jgi:PKD repeat protein
LAGYKIYYGPAAGSYTASVDVGNVTSYTFTSLPEGAAYHFAATAYDTLHRESDYSNDVEATVPSGRPVASFSASTTSGVAPLALNFANESTGSITSYAWYLGDGSTSSAQNPSHVYAAPGVYTVSLVVTGPGGSSIQTRSEYITVSLGAPMARFTANRTSGASPLAVDFSNASSGLITSYFWSFGDGAASSDYNPSHVYPYEGTFTVSLTVAGPGGSDTQTRSDYINVSALDEVAATTTVLTSDPNPSAFSEPLAITATVTGVSPTGLVLFTDGGAPIADCEAVPLGEGGDVATAVCNTRWLWPGDHSLVATYLGDANNAGSASPEYVQSVFFKELPLGRQPAGSPVYSSLGPYTVGLTMTGAGASNR